MKARVMKTAWAIAAHFSTFADALRRAWKIVKLSFSLKRGVVAFSYLKKDGSIRNATGTLDNTPPVAGSGKPKNYATFTYFDIEANGWRCACAHNLIF